MGREFSVAPPGSGDQDVRILAEHAISPDIVNENIGVFVVAPPDGEAKPRDVIPSGWMPLDARRVFVNRDGFPFPGHLRGKCAGIPAVAAPEVEREAADGSRLVASDFEIDSIRAAEIEVNVAVPDRAAKLAVVEGAMEDKRPGAVGITSRGGGRTLFRDPHRASRGVIGIVAGINHPGGAGMSEERKQQGQGQGKEGMAGHNEGG